MEEIIERQLLIRGRAYAAFSTIEKALAGRKKSFRMRSAGRMLYNPVLYARTSQTMGCDLRPHLGWRNVILGSRNKWWQIWYTSFCKLCKKSRSRPVVNLFLLHFSSNTMLHAVSYLLGCLRELSNHNNQPSTTSYALLHHGVFNAQTNIALVAFIQTRRHACV